MNNVNIFYFSNIRRKCIISEELFVLELPTSRAMLATARPSCMYAFNDSYLAKQVLQV